jgi:hypothetical protein
VVIGYAFESKGFSRVDIDTNESDPVYSLAGQLMGMPLKPLQGFVVSAESFDFRQQTAGLGDGGTLARLRLAVAHRASVSRPSSGRRVV